MPERPDLEYFVPMVRSACIDRTISSATVRNPVVMRVAVEGRFEDLIAGRVIQDVTRRAHFVVFTLSGDDDLVISPMLAGRFELCAPTKRMRKDVALTLEVGDDEQLRYRDDVQMGKVYLVPRAKADKIIPGYAPIGVDVLSKAFTVPVLAKLVKKRRDQVKVFLKDKKALDALGNAYADEVLWAAGLHPKIRCNKLTPEQVERLHGAIVSVLTEACQIVAERGEPMDVKVRDFLRVRNRKGEACPTCGTTIRAAGVHGHDAFFCPSCQPDESGRGFVDWRRVRSKEPR